MTQIKKLYDQYIGSMAYVEIMNDQGDVEIGSAFHIGEGYLVTAKHVADNKILSIGTTERCYVPDENGTAFIVGDDTKYRSLFPKQLTLIGNPYLHPDEKIDVAIIQIEEKDLVSVELGAHLDDWINDSAFVLWDVLIMGYPPIPGSKEPVLVAASGQINAVVDRYDKPHVHFIVSCMARGGFSGGVCLTEHGWALGVITESSNRNNLETELGFLTVLTVEPIFDCLVHHGITTDILLQP